MRLPLRSLLLAKGQGVQSMRASHAMAYSESRIVGFSREQMFDVVSQVEHYHQFVPWCRRSDVLEEGPHLLLAELEVGFPPINAAYTSRVTYIRPAVVHSVAEDPEGGLFRLLDTTWRFSSLSVPQSHSPAECRIHFDLSFQFRSSAHAKLAHLFFDKVVQKNVGAFLSRAEELFGPPSRPPSKPQVLKYDS